MFSFLLKHFTGRHYRKFLERVSPIVTRIVALEEEYQGFTDEQLRAKTEEFRARIAAAPDSRAALEEVLPEAFAAVKNAARRLVGRKISVCEHELVWDMVHF
jgi:preprotein translocase subunit SecA